MQLSLDYLAARGISEETIRIHGIEIDEEINQKRARERLGRSLPKGTNEVIWIPLYEASGNILFKIARPLPTVGDNPKFLCPLGSSGLPYIPKGVYALAHGRWIIITEGPVKALTIVQAGFDAIGVNGVWGIGTKNSRDNYRYSGRSPGYA